MAMPREGLDRLRRAGAATLRAAGVETPELDARLLLQHATGLDHADLIASGQQAVESAAFDALIRQRCGGEPVSRILGSREFHGLDFRLSPAVLDPRPDTETLVTVALSEPFASVLDLGTGSGAIIVSLLHARGEARGTATDISDDALAVAAGNAALNGISERLTCLRSDWFSAVTGRFDLVVSNPPYIAEGEIAGLDREVRGHDPLLALCGGADGLDAYRAIAAGLAPHLSPSGRALVEIGATQAQAVSAIFAAHGLTRTLLAQDLAGRDRVLGFRSKRGTPP